MNEQRSIHRLRAAGPRPFSARRSVALAAALAACAFVLALAAPGIRSRVGAPPAEQAPSRTLGYAVAAILGVMYGIGIWSYLSARFRPDEDEEEAAGGEQAPLFQRILIRLALAAIAVLPVIALLSWRSRQGTGQGHGKPPGSGLGPRLSSHTSQLHWSYLAVAAAGALLGIAGLAILLRRRSQGMPEPDERAHLTDAVTAGIDELEGDPDPRRAVIRAYAAMEGSLAGHGLPRREAETPLEYLSRIFTDAEAGAPAAARLTPLYEQARFSTHEIDEEMRSRAVRALEDLRAELEA